MLPLLALALAAAPTAHADTCGAYATGAEVATLVAPGLIESSGVAASRTRDGVWFTHNDGGSEPVLYAFDLKGNLLDQHDVHDADNDDWEDIAAAPCPDVGDCLYIGDIGNNDSSREAVTVYVVREPGEGKNAKTIARWTAIYPDVPRDAETLLVHPCTGRVYIVSKAGGGSSQVYRMPLDPGRDVVTLEKVGDVDIPGGATGGDWDLDGDRLVLRSATNIWEWQTDPDRPNDHWSSTPTELASAISSDGEGVAYGLGGEIVLTSEGSPMSIVELTCTNLTSADHACEFPQSGCRGCKGSRGWLFLPLVALLRRRYRGPTIASSDA